MLPLEANEISNDALRLYAALKRMNFMDARDDMIDGIYHDQAKRLGEEFAKIKEEDDKRTLDALRCPATVLVNILRGTIAKPTIRAIIELYGAETLREELKNWD